MLDFSVTFVITIFNIILLAFILKAVLFKPVSRFMAERAKRIQDSIDEAKTERANAQELLEQCREKLKAADTEAEEIIKSAKENARVQADKIVAEGKLAAEALVAEAHSRLESERQKALARFGMEAAALVMAASSRLVQREFTADDSRRYAGMLLDELAAKPVPAPHLRKGNG